MTEANAEAVVDKATVPGTPEYDAAMTARFRESQSTVGEELVQAMGGEPDKTGTESGKPVKPDNVPDKFWDAEKGEVRYDELLKSYTELEANKGKAAAEPTTAEGQAAEQTAEQKAAAEAVEKAGLKWDDLTAKVTKDGKIDEADYAALEKIGIPKAFVDSVIANEVALAGYAKEAQDRATVDAMSYIGGQSDPVANSKATAELLGWAKEALTPAQIEGYNKMLAGADWKVAVDTLKTMRTQAIAKAGGSEPNLLNPKGITGGSTIGYQSQDEMQADMGKALYNEMSPAGAQFRAQVQEKVRLAAWRRG